MKYMVKSKILATFCAGLLTVSTGIQAAERLATGTQQKQAQKTVIETSPWFDDKDLTLTGVYYYPEHWDESQWERDFKKMHELGFEFTHFAEFAWAQLEPEERAMFLEDMGITESGLDRLIRKSYDLLGLMSFLTAGPKEVRAWTIRKGTKAPQAAGKIHSDFERGFIRAEVVSFDDLVAKGSMAAVRDAGLLRSEGKDYVMQDGDIVLFRFNV